MTLDAYWTERRVRAMGSTAHLVVGDAATALVDWAVDELARLEHCWSRFRADSALVHLNASAGNWTVVPPALFDALEKSRALFEVTGGAFDPTMLGALEAAGYDRSFDTLDREQPGRVADAAVPGFATVELDAPGRRVRVAPGTRVDLGGIGKGLAADLVARGLVERGARTALVSVGGDLSAYGEPPAGGWAVPVEDPFDDALDARRSAFVHHLHRGGLVASTTRIRAWTRGGRPMHHIVDPATGAPSASGVTAAVVTAAHAWWAEGIAKAIVVVGAERGLALARRAGVHAWCFTDTRDVVEVDGTGAAAA